VAGIDRDGAGDVAAAIAAGRNGVCTGTLVYLASADSYFVTGRFIAVSCG